MQIHLCLALFLFISSSACKGQVTSSPSHSAAIRKIPQAKIIKTRGTNEYSELGCGLLDKAGNLWFGTTGEGVYRYNGASFTNFTRQDGLGSDSVYFMFEDKRGKLWLGSRQSLCQYDDKTFTNIPIPGLNGIDYQNFKNNLSSKNELWSMMQDRSGKIWLGTTEGIYCYDGKSFTRLLDNRNILNKDSVKLKWTQCIFEDKAGNIWFASWVLANEGICRYDGKAITQFKPYGEGWVRAVLEDKNGDLLAVTRHKGVCRFNGVNFTNFTENSGIDNASVTNAIVDKRGNLWMGTELGSGNLMEDGGLWCYDGKTFKRFTRKDGLIHNGVFCLVEDRSGNIWAGTRNTGLCRFDGKTFTAFSE